MIFILPVLFTKQFSCDEDKKNWVGGANGTFGGE